MAKIKYHDGYVFDSGVILIHRKYKTANNQFVCDFKCPRCNKIFEAKLRDVAFGDTKSCGCLNHDHRVQLGKSKAKNLIGKRFGKLTVIEDSGKRSGRGHIIWTCQCDCGNTTEVSSNNLVRGNVFSCGCIREADLTGQRFGKLIAIEKIKNNNRKGIFYKCQCDCGNVVYVSSTSLASGVTKSCGCMKSYGESKLRFIFDSLNIQYESQKRFDDCVNPHTNYQLKFDFYLPDKNICVEYDGKQHFTPIEHFGGVKAFEDGKYRDSIKNEYCNQHGIRMIRISYKEIDNINEEYILNLLN